MSQVQQQQQPSPLGGFKVFVGHIPSTMTEESLSQLFGEFGNIVDISIIKDKRTNQPKGCAFINFSTKEEADLAINTINSSNRYLENMNKPLQVKYSDNEIEKMERKLFLGMLGSANETDVTNIFSKFGQIEDLTIVREKDGRSKGYGFIKFTTRESSDLAIREVDGKVTLPGSTIPIIVKFADTERQKRKKMLLNGNNPTPNMPFNYGYPQQSSFPFFGYNQNQMPQMNNQNYQRQPYQHVFPNIQMHQPHNNFNDYAPESNDLFIYYLPTHFGDDELRGLFEPIGNVISCKVFIDKVTRQSKCFGFVTYDNTASAINAINQLNGFQIDGKKLKVTFKRERS